MATETSCNIFLQKTFSQQLLATCHAPRLRSLFSSLFLCSCFFRVHRPVVTFQLLFNHLESLTCFPASLAACCCCFCFPIIFLTLNYNCVCLCVCVWKLLHATFIYCNNNNERKTKATLAKKVFCYSLKLVSRKVYGFF